MKKITQVLFSVFLILFLCGWVWGVISLILRCETYQNYTDLQPESFAPNEIETVLYHEELKQIYVCYNEANCVNVYTESGDFLWTVGTPYLRNSCFELQGDRLIIYDGDAYVYDARSGEFLELEKEENLDLHYDWKQEGTNEFREGNFYFDSYQVYRANSDGTLFVIVSRPWWHRIFHFLVGWCIAAVGGIGMGIITFLEKKASYNHVKKKVKIQNRKARVILKYFKITSAVQLVYAVLDVVFARFGGVLCIGILPLALHFIVSNWVLWNMLDHLSVDQDERKVLDYWKAVEFVTFLIAFVSVVIAAGIAG